MPPPHFCRWNPGLYYHSPEDGHHNHWLQLELPSERTVTRVVLQLRNCCTGRNTHLQVMWFFTHFVENKDWKLLPWNLINYNNVLTTGPCWEYSCDWWPPGLDLYKWRVWNYSKWWQWTNLDMSTRTNQWKIHHSSKRSKHPSAASQYWGDCCLCRMSRSVIICEILWAKKEKLCFVAIV